MTRPSPTYHFLRQPIWTLLLFQFLTRFYNLTALPLHNDEGLHLTRAIAVWRGHPFWDISDGKIINHWFMALFFPQHVPDFAGRYPTVLFAVMGLAAGYALLKHIAGRWVAFWGALFWVMSPYLFFFERLAQSDPEAGAWVVISVWAALLLAERGHWRWALLTGVTFSTAVLLKFTAAPYALVLLLLIVSVGRVPWGQRVRNLLLIGGVGVLAFTPPVVYLLLRGQGLFTIALGWVGSGVYREGWDYNARTLLDQLSGFGPLGPFWALLLLIGWVALLWLGDGRLRRLWGYSVVPLAVIIVASALVLPRHFIVGMPLLLLLAGAGWGLLLMRGGRGVQWGGGAALLLFLAAYGLPFMATATTSPADLQTTALIRREYFTDHGGGFGLRDAMYSLHTQVPRGEPVIASMFPASCRRANFYTTPVRALTCTDVPGTEAILAQLDAAGVAYVLVDELPGIGVDVTTLDATVTRLRAYPRPGEDADSATVVLYRLAR